MRALVFAGIVACYMLLLAAIAFTPGCAPRVIDDKPNMVEVPVTAPCVTDRPAKVVALRDRIQRPAWLDKTPKQKAEEVGAQGLRRQTYGDKLEAATAACP